MSVQVLTLFDLEPVEQKAPEVKKKRASKIVEEHEEETENTTSSSATVITKTKKDFSVIAEPLNAEKNYYTIGETAKMFKVRTSHIRFWTVQFALKVRTTRKGDRLYTPENIERIKLIHYLVKEQGFTIAGAKARLKELKNVSLESLQKINIIDTLKSLKATLVALRSQV